MKTKAVIRFDGVIFFWWRQLQCFGKPFTRFQTDGLNKKKPKTRYTFFDLFIFPFLSFFPPSYLFVVVVVFSLELGQLSLSVAPWEGKRRRTLGTRLELGLLLVQNTLRKRQRDWYPATLRLQRNARWRNHCSQGKRLALICYEGVASGRRGSRLNFGRFLGSGFPSMN